MAINENGLQNFKKQVLIQICHRPPLSYFFHFRPFIIKDEIIKPLDNEIKKSLHPNHPSTRCVIESINCLLSVPAQQGIVQSVPDFCNHIPQLLPLRQIIVNHLFSLPSIVTFPNQMFSIIGKRKRLIKLCLLTLIVIEI